MSHIHQVSSIERRKRRVRSKVRGTELRPRLTVHRTNQHIYAQIINDAEQITLVAASDHSALSSKQKSSGVAKAEAVGKEIAEKAVKKGISSVVFDRGSYAYHGRIKALAEAARSAGLIF